MVDAAKAFAKEPPRQPLTSLDAIVEDFQWRYVDRKKTDQVIAHCRAAPTLGVAINRAVRSRDADGKHHNHQSKVDLTARLELGRALRRNRPGISRIMRMDREDRFDAFHDLIDEIKPFGIGPVTVYDVAVRVGAFLNIEPTSVYMHAGVKQGFRAMVEALERMEHPKAHWYWRHIRDAKIRVNNFPRPLDSMRADDVEDILCTYRQVFETWGR